MAVEVEKQEKEVLERMVESGVFKSEGEAVRASILSYASELGLFDTGEIWERIDSRERRDVSPEQLREDLEELE